MKIENLKINAFGKLKNKEIEFDNHINIIQGKNESGKSTLLKFIESIFYGTSKNKNGKVFSDYDKYKPWDSSEFSGKLSYRLDDGEKFEVFREFGGKKNPRIYNEEFEDVSKNYSIDKTYGNQYFYEQTGVDETMFLSTVVSMQQEVKLERNVQNTMLQKVANLASTGDDNTSYKKAIEKLNKKQVEEIGTIRTQGRPINIIKEEKFKIQDEIGDLENYKSRKEKIEIEKKQKQEQILLLDENLELLKRIKEIKENEKLEKERINISENLKKNQEERKQLLEENKNNKEKEISYIKDDLDNIEENGKEKESYPIIKRNTSISLIIICLILGVLSIFLLKNLVMEIVVAIVLVISIIWLIFEVRNAKRFEKRKQERIRKNEEVRKQKEIELETCKTEVANIQAEINILNNNIEQYEKNIKNEIRIIEDEKENKINKLKENAKEDIVENIIKIENLQEEKELQEREINNKKLEYNSLELEEKEIIPKLEQAAILEERLDELQEQEEKLEKDNEAIELTKQLLETAYLKMRQNITPKLTEELSKSIQKISNGRYSNINLHEEDGIIIEKENGEYVEAEKLSVRNN